MKRRSFLAKILSSAIAAPAVAGIIERGISKPLPDAKCVGVTGCMEYGWDPRLSSTPGNFQFQEVEIKCDFGTVKGRTFVSADLAHFK